MAGRGRGRGRGSMSFNVESLGFGRGESLPGSSIEPPPLFPSLEYKPVPLVGGEEQDYLLALKQEFRRAMRDSPYYIKPLDKKRDIERYSDKYQLSNPENGSWEIDWKRFPLELKAKVKKKKKESSLKPNVKKVKIKEDEIVKTFEALEQKEEMDDKEVVENQQDDEENEEEEEEAVGEDGEEVDEDDFEDETDYNQTYFDNGENYGHDEEDDLDDGPTY